MKAPVRFLNLGLVVTLNLGLQFLFQWYIITSMGAGFQTDALFGAMALPQFILTVLSGSLTMVLIPMIAAYEGDAFETESWNYFQAIGALFTLIAILLFFTASIWVGWLLPGFHGANFQLAVELSRVQLLAMVLSALLSVIWAVHSARGNFIKIETTSILANCLAMGLLMLFIHRLGIQAVAWITVLRVLIQVLLLLKVMGKYRKPHFRSPSFQLAWVKLRPLMAGNAYYKTDSLVDRFLTSKGISGELTLFNLAQQLYGVGNSIATKVFVNTMIPELSRAHQSGDERAFSRILRTRLLTGLLITGAVFLSVGLIGQWMLTLVFALKKFNPADVTRLWWIMVMLGGYWIGGLIGGITSGAFYARGNTVTPTRIGSVVFTLYLPLKVFCYLRFGVTGLAISITAYYLISCGVQLYFLRRHLR